MSGLSPDPVHPPVTDGTLRPVSVPVRFPVLISNAPPSPPAPPVNVDAPLLQYLTFLGTGSSIPSHRRCTSGLVLTLNNGSALLLDCGEGIQLQFARSRLRVPRIDAVLITHLHGDHFYGLWGLLSTMAANGRTEPVTIVGPLGLRPLVEAVLGSAGGFTDMPLLFRGIEEGLEHDVGLVAGLHVHASPIQHTIPCFAYTLTEQQRPGPMLVDKAKALGVVGPQMRRLKEGKTVTTAKGDVRPEDCLGPPAPPFRLALVQDTSDCRAAYPQLQGLDVLIHECTYEAGMEQKAADHGHSTSAQAGRVARDVGAKALILTHFSTRYLPGMRNRRELGYPQVDLDREEDDMVDADQLVDEALEAWKGGGEGGERIPVWAAEDFLHFQRTPQGLVVKEYALSSNMTRMVAEQKVDDQFRESLQEEAKAEKER